MWVVGHLRDVESDLSAFHHLRRSEAYALPGPEFFALAYRLPAYPGVVRARLRASARAADEAPEVVDVTPEALAAYPDLAGLFEEG